MHIVLSIAFACFICLAGLAPATIVIDDFSTAQSVPQLTTQTVTGPGILGQERYVRTYTGTTAEINTTYPNQAYFSNLLGGVALRYDGIGTEGLNNFDLTEGGQNTGFQISITDIGPADVYVRISVTDNAGYLAALNFWVSEPEDLFFPFKDFFDIGEAGLGIDILSPQMTSAPVDFTNTQSIQVTIYSYDSPSSITLGSLTVVPEPATLCLLALGVFALRGKQK